MGFPTPDSHHVHRQAGIRPGDGLSSAAHVLAVCPTISIKLSHEDILPSRSVLVHGLCAVDLSRQPARYRSLFRAHASKLYHLGIRGHVARSTLADANEKRDWRIYHDFANALIATARKLYADEDFGVDLANTVYALDTTTIDLSLSVFPWAHFRTTKAAVKMHTQIDLRGNIPSFIHVSDGKMHEVNAPRKMPSKPKSGSRSPSTCSSPSSKSAWTCRRRSTQFCRFSVSHSLKKHHSINCLTTSQPKLSTQTSLTK